MIVAVVGLHAGSGSAFLAANLALLRARAGRRLLLIEADPGQPVASWSRRRVAAGLKPNLACDTILGGELGVHLERLTRRYSDMVIHTEGRDTLASRAAMIAARLAVVALPAQADLQQSQQLIDRLRAVRLFNPALRLLFVVVGAAPDAERLAVLRAQVAQVAAATLVSEVMHVPSWSWPQDADGHCVCEAPERDTRAAAEIKGLYREVFSIPQMCAA